MSQQLSVKVARVIRQRFIDLYGGEPTPQQIVDTPFEKLRAIGLSNAKVSYVQNVAKFEMEKGMDHKKLAKMDNEEVIAYLTQIKGVGRWTTEMLLMFALCREDVFAPDDLGLQQAVIGLYDLKHRKKKIMLEKIIKISGNGALTELMPACIYGDGRITRRFWIRKGRSDCLNARFKKLIFYRVHVSGWHFCPKNH